MALSRGARSAGKEGEPSRARGTIGGAIRDGYLTAEELEELDVLLDAPQLEVRGLALEIEELELGGLLRIGRVRLEAQNLDAQLYLQARLDDLVDLVDRLLATVDLGLTLFWAPVYNFNLMATAAYKNLETARSWFEAPGRPGKRPVRGRDPLALGGPAGRATRPSGGRRGAVRRTVSEDGEVIATLLDENGEVLDEKIIGRLRSAARGEIGGGEAEPEGGSMAEGAIGRASRIVRRTVEEASGDIIEHTLDESGKVTGEEVRGNVRDLPVEEERTDDDGRLVRRLRDDSGASVEQVLDEEGNTLDLRVIE